MAAVKAPSALAAELEALRKDVELRFTGNMAERLVNALDAAATALRTHTDATERSSENARLRSAIANIQREAERENGNWAHLKRCIAAQSRAALEPPTSTVDGWRPIEEAPPPIGEPFLAALEVRNNKTGYSFWERHVIWIDDETGNIASECEAGWTLVDDYTHWQPLPEPPTSTKPYDYYADLGRDASTEGEGA